MSKRNRKTDRAAGRKVALAPVDPTTEPAPTEPPAAPSPSEADVIPPPSPGDTEDSLARMPNDGVPPAPDTDDVSLARMPEPVAPPSPLPPPPVPLTAPVATPVDLSSLLERRIRRIEETLARIEQLHGAAAHAKPPPTAIIVSPTPAAAPASTAALFDMSKRLLGAAANVVMHVPPPPTGAAPSGGAGLLWLLRDTWVEARIIVRMYVDPRYHLPWTARVLPLLLLAALLTWRYWVPGASIPILGELLLVKPIELLLAFVLFKWLGHESRRYRQTSPDLPPTLRL